MSFDLQSATGELKHTGYDHPVEDPIPDPEPSVPSRPGPDLAVFHHNIPETPAKDESE
jgi:hypothetical protein